MTPAASPSNNAVCFTCLHSFMCRVLGPPLPAPTAPVVSRTCSGFDQPRRLPLPLVHPIWFRPGAWTSAECGIALLVQSNPDLHLQLQIHFNSAPSFLHSRLELQLACGLAHANGSTMRIPSLLTTFHRRKRHSFTNGLGQPFPVHRLTTLQQPKEALLCMSPLNMVEPGVGLD